MPIVLAGATSGSSTIQATDAVTVTLTLPSTSGTLSVSGGSPSFATLTVTGDATINGLTVGKGGANGAANTAFGVNAIPIAPNSGVVAIGNNAGASFNTASDTAQSTFIGYYAGAAVNTGVDNTFLGGVAGRNTTTGSNNIAVGGYSFFTNTTGSYNTVVGKDALRLNTTASNNTAVGYQAGYSNVTNQQNVFVGSQAGYYVTSDNNVIIGLSGAAYGGNNLTTGRENIYIGSATRASAGNVNDVIVIGYYAMDKGTGTGMIGATCYQGNNSTLWSVTSDQRLKKNIVDNNIGLEKITQIKVRNFEYRLPQEVTELDPSHAIQIEGLQLGPIAQELKEILPECVKTESTGVMSVDASNLTWYLVNAVKELNAKVTQLEAQLAGAK